MLGFDPLSTTPLSSSPGTPEGPPVVLNFSPTGADNASTATIKFDLIDAGVYPVNLASVVVHVNGTIAYASSAPQNGFTAVVAAITSGYRFTITPPLPWGLGQTITVTVDAADTAP